MIAFPAELPSQQPLSINNPSCCECPLSAHFAKGTIFANVSKVRLADILTEMLINDPPLLGGELLAMLSIAKAHENTATG